MLYHATGKYEEGVADVDPTANPAGIILSHVFQPPLDAPKNPSTLYLALLGTGTEAVTLSLYFLIETFGPHAKITDYVNSSARWFLFDSSEVVTNGTLTRVTADLPAGGIIYGSRTNDSITAGQTRSIVMAWQ